MGTYATGELDLRGEERSGDGLKRSLMYEFRRNFTGDFSLDDAWTESVGTVSGQPGTKTLRAFLDFVYAYGDAWGETTLLTNFGYVERITTGAPRYSLEGLSGVTDPDDIIFTADKNESCKITKDSSGTDYNGSEGVDVYFYRRANRTSDSWVEVANYTGYAGQTISCDFAQYDYKFKTTA